MSNGPLSEYSLTHNRAGEPYSDECGIDQADIDNADATMRDLEHHSTARHRAACDSLAPWATEAREVNARMDSETSDAFRDALQEEAN